MSKGVLVAHNKLEANLQGQHGQGGHGAIPLSAGMLLVTLGVVYGDIGTSPMYTMKSIVANNGGIGTVSEDMILGALSLVIWTMTLVTTVKYVVIAMKADNHNEGGIFALFSLVRKVAPWLILPAMIGGAALLADGILTPAVTVTTAIEGLRTIEWGHALLGDGQTNVIIITIIIICGLFAMQRAGTSSIGKLFGPLMTLWFLFLAGAGLFNMLGNLSILRALNPIRGIMFLFSPINHSGIMVLGFVFLSTTGAEALYSDMGHVGKANIYTSWPFVKAALILNYLGQGAWLLANNSNPQMLAMDIVNPFYMMLPEPCAPLPSCFRPWRPSSPRRRSLPARSRWFRRQRASTLCRTCASTTPATPRASSIFHSSTTSCGSAVSSSCCCSRTPSAWRVPMASPLP